MCQVQCSEQPFTFRSIVRYHTASVIGSLVTHMNRDPRPAVRATTGQERMRRRAEARRLDILRAAARVFRDKGLAAAGMREIALEADLSPANLYHYFQSKDEILFFCQDRSLDRLLDGLAVARSTRAPVLERLRALAVTHVHCLLDEVHGGAAHNEVDTLPPALRAPILAKRDAYERGVRALIAGGMRRRELRRTDSTIVTRAFLGALNWTAAWFRADGSATPRRVATLVSDYAVAGLVGPGQQGVLHAPTPPHRPDGERRADPGRLRAI